MLLSVRKYTQGWIATAMSVILALTFLLWGIESYLNVSSKKNVAAKVNGKEIAVSEVDDDLKHLVMQKNQLAGDLHSVGTEKELKSHVLNNLIIQNVLTQAAVKLGFKVTPQETSAVIKQMPAFQEEGHFSKNRFSETISKMGWTQHKFFTDVSNALLRNQTALSVIGSEFILPNELTHLVALLKQKRDIEYVIMTNKPFLNNIKISADKINRYYNQYKNQFKLPASVQIEYIQLSANDLNRGIKISEQDIDDRFNANGDLDRKNPSVIGKVRETLQQQKLEQAFLAATDKLTDLTYTHPDTLVDAAHALGLKMNTSDYFTPKGGKTFLTQHPKIIAQAFSSDSLKNRLNSNLIEISPGRVVVLRVKGYQPETFASINEVKEKIRHALIESEANEKVRQQGEEIVRQIKNKDDFKKLAQKAHLSIIARQVVSRDEKNIHQEVLRAVFRLPSQLRVPVTSISLPNGDFAIVLVKDISLPPNKITPEQRSNWNNFFSDNYGKLEYGLYIQSQMQKSKIKLYPIL
jgi:SurA N-terminal domain